MTRARRPSVASPKACVSRPSVPTEQPLDDDAAGFPSCVSGEGEAEGGTVGGAEPGLPEACGAVVGADPAVPLPTSAPRSNPPNGDVHIFVAVGGAPASTVRAAAVPESGRADADPDFGVAGGGWSIPETARSVHFQVAGQSLSVVHDGCLRRQEPGNEVMVVQEVAPASAGNAPEPLAPPVPVAGDVVGPVVPAGAEPPEGAAPREPEQAVDVVGWQVNPAPQSASALQGSCQRNAQAFVVVVMHWSGSVLTGVAGQAVFGGQGATAAPPEQAVDVSSWQTIPSPQSASLLQDFGMQVETVVSVGAGAG